MSQKVLLRTALAALASVLALGVGAATASANQGGTASAAAESSVVPMNGSMTGACYGVVLRYGSTGDCVRVAQMILNFHGYGLAVDGFYGPATTSAIRDVQAKNGLVVDGIVGQNTWIVLAWLEFH